MNSARRGPTVNDLVSSGAVVDLHLGHRGCSGEEVLKGVVLIASSRTWITAEFRRRGVAHTVNIPCSAVRLVDSKTRIVRGSPGRA